MLNLKIFIIALLYILFLASCSSENHTTQSGSIPKASVQLTPLNRVEMGTVFIEGTAKSVFTLTNYGQGTATQLTGDFALSQNFTFCGGSFPGTEGSCGQTLAPNLSCTVQVCLSPQEVGPINESLYVGYFDGTQFRQSNGVQLTGRGNWGAPGSWDTTLLESGHTSQFVGDSSSFWGQINYVDGKWAFFGKYNLGSELGVLFEKRSNEGMLEKRTRVALNTDHLGQVKGILQLDEQVLVAIESHSLRLLRFDKEGVIDRSFGSSGILEISSNSGDIHLGGVVQLYDRRMLVAGEHGGQGKVWGFNARGETDTAFGTQGVLAIDWDGRIISSIDSFWMIQSKVFLAATIGTIPQQDWAIIAFDGNGLFDPAATFIYDLEGGSQDRLRAAHSRNANEVWMVGDVNDKLWVRKFPIGGTIVDWNEAIPGFVATALSLSIDGSVEVGGERAGGISLVRLTSLLERDLLFGENGQVDYDLVSGGEHLYGVSQLISGKTLVMGAYENGASWFGRIW